MSASTVSITANTAAAAVAARRRPVLVGEKKSNTVELISNDGVNGNAHSDAAGDVSNSLDRGKSDAVLERSSKDGVRRTTAVTATTQPRRTRKAAGSVTKAEKPRWLTIASVFAKNFVLLAVLAGLIQMVRRLAFQPENSGTLTGLSDFEGRIADVESLMKKTASMVQVQVEVIDKKLEREVGGLRSEFNEKIEETTKNLERELKELESKTGGLEKSLSELQLKIGDWLPKEELENLYEELVKKRKNGGVSDLSLDDIQLYAREVVMKEIEKHAADGLGRVDYALARGGAEVVKHSEPFNLGGSWLLSKVKGGVRNDPAIMLTPSFGEPGQCFALQGSNGFVQIRLRTAIVPEAITLEHVSKSVAYDRTSAPKLCRISGWMQENDRDNVGADEKRILLTEFSYDLEKSNAQTFNVFDSVSSGMVNMVRLDILSNHGASSHTCIYRLRVHGREPESVPMLPAE
ncbi:SUN domain-containing protein 1 [Rutidosis leptorrhynchoides]|uniref:SUN domain-containing protein 1 n=1 Tax=Rutidosis leptorrhynchoides TaxID=125765 RepID=UPI003A9A41C2